MTFLELFAFFLLPATLGLGGLAFAFAYRRHMDREAKRIGK